MPESISQTVSAHYDELTPSMRKVADYLLGCQEEAQYLSITELANECGVGKATVSRLCHALGFEGYNHLKLALARASSSAPGASAKVSRATQGESVEAMASDLLVASVSAMRQTLELADWAAVERVVDILCSADEVCCMGQGGGLVLAMEAWSRFMTVSGKFRYVENTHSQILTASLLGKSSVVLYVSYSGATVDAYDVLTPARARGAKVILITRHKSSPTAELADEVLLCGGREGPLDAGSVSVRVGVLLLVDVLFNECCRRNEKLAAQARDLTSDAIMRRML